MSAHAHRRLAGTGVIATLAAVLVTTLAAAFVRALGIEFEVPDGGETIPLAGIAFVTGVSSIVGIVIAAALLRWSARPRERFVRTAMALTTMSLAPPWLVGAAASTSAALVGLHLVAATVMIPAVTQSLRAVSTTVAEPSRR